MAKYLKKRKEQDAQTPEDITKNVKEILDDIQWNGDKAVQKYSRKFDNWTPTSFKISNGDIRHAKNTLPETLKDDIHFASRQITYFAEKQLETLSEMEVETLPGIYLGHKLVPVNTVGNYIPGGRYPLISSAMMSTIPAKVAGVKRISSFSPPSQQGKGLPPEIIYALHMAGSDDIYSLGGVQAIGSMAYGTETIRSVDMITGPGNAFVSEAKRQVYGKVGIDLLAGPSEILIIADDAADPAMITADLIAQAEHDPFAKSVLITSSETLAESVLSAIPDYLDNLETSDVARVAWENNGEVAVVKDRVDAAHLSDWYAAEHVEVQTNDNEWFLDNLQHYGSLFLGEESTVVYSDVVIGTNHILPTMGASRHTSGVWVGKFIKTQTYQRLNKKGSQSIAPIASRQALSENLIGHSLSAKKRMRKYR